VTKLVPLNVIVSPPWTYPHLGLIAVKNGVFEDVYVTVPPIVIGAAPFKEIYIGHVE